MPRRPLIAGNWRMHKTVNLALGVLDSSAPGLENLNLIHRVDCPPFAALRSIRLANA